MLAPALKGRPITKLTELRTSQRKIKGWLSSKQWEHIIMETPNNAFYIMNYLMFLLVVQIGSLFVSLPHALDSSWVFYFIFYFFFGGEEGGITYIHVHDSSWMFGQTITHRMRFGLSIFSILCYWLLSYL